MSSTTHHSRGSVLISGAGIAGSALAFWLDRYGFNVTVVERAASIRSGGYPIDIRGTAIDVIERMGLLSQVQEAHIASRDISFVDAAGALIETLPVYDVVGSETDRDVELPRGMLTNLIYDRTRNSRVRYRFEESIDAIEAEGAGVQVRLKSGERQRYGLVIGADGIHSQTRRLAFGPETPFSHYLGAAFALFSLPNDLGLSHGAVVYAEPGRAAMMLAVRNSPELFAMLTFAAESPSVAAQIDREEQIRLMTANFSGCGWEVPRLLEAMRCSKDLYFDTLSQIRMPSWSKGGVALVGDAAFAPSFRSGQGTSLALIGAYILAGELASHSDAADGLAAYERVLRPFVEANQDLAIKSEGDLLLPRTPEELAARNHKLAALRSRPLGTSGGSARATHNALALPDYDSSLQW